MRDKFKRNLLCLIAAFLAAYALGEFGTALGWEKPNSDYIEIFGALLAFALMWGYLYWRHRFYGKGKTDG